jgi:Na+/melibiose symporter-like transporter
MQLPLANPAFRRLLLVFMVNGVASALPATLVLFFVRDRLQLPAYEALFLFAYFAAGAASMPLWVRAVAHYGLARLWLAGMGLSIAAFVWAVTLGPGDWLAFTAICIASGLALGADLALPSSLLAGVIQRAGHAGRAEGAYFGWWNFAIKLNLALAAGLALPLLSRLGYTPGTRDADALLALALAYGLLPCALKLLAGVLLIGVWMRTPYGEPR